MKSVASMLTGLALLGMSAAPSWAQEHAQDYPNRQVNFVVPFAPGGGTDILGRLVGQKLSDRFGKPFVVENRPGAGTVDGGGPGREEHARRLHHHDGDQSARWRSTSRSTRSCPTIRARISIPAALICNVPFVLVVNPALPVHSVADLLKLAKEQPLSYGSGGAGAFHHLMGELFKTSIRNPDDACALQGHAAGAQRRHRRSHPADVQRPCAGAAADPGRQGACAWRDDGAARGLGAANSPAAEVGAPGFDWAAWQSVAAPGERPRTSSPSSTAR